MKLERNKIILGDCLPNLKSIKDDSFDVTFTSPPYGDTGTETFEEIRAKGKGNNPNGTHRKYLNVESHADDWFEWQVEIINELLRVSKKCVIYNIGAIYPNKANVYKLIGYFAENIQDV